MFPRLLGRIEIGVVIVGGAGPDVNAHHQLRHRPRAMNAGRPGEEGFSTKENGQQAKAAAEGQRPTPAQAGNKRALAAAAG